MSYQLSALGEIDIPANEQLTPSKSVTHRYAVAYVVLFYNKQGVFEFVDYGVSVETAIHEGRAIDAVFNPLTKKYRECNGYICRVKVEQIAD